MISVEAKKEFIQYFLKRHRLKKMESVWMLSYLLNHESTLKNVVFITNAREHSRSMSMSTMNSTELPFLFYEGNMMTSNGEYAYQELRLHGNEKLYIQLNYPDSHVCLMYAKVLEDKPTNSDEISLHTKKDAAQLIAEMEARLINSEFDRLINEALDTGDNKAFMYLTGEFMKMGEEMK